MSIRRGHLEPRTQKLSKIAGQNQNSCGLFGLAEQRSCGGGEKTHTAMIQLDQNALERLQIDHPPGITAALAAEPDGSAHEVGHLQVPLADMLAAVAQATIDPGFEVGEDRAGQGVTVDDSARRLA